MWKSELVCSVSCGFLESEGRQNSFKNCVVWWWEVSLLLNVIKFYQKPEFFIILLLIFFYSLLIYALLNLSFCVETFSCAWFFCLMIFLWQLIQAIMFKEKKYCYYSTLYFWCPNHIIQDLIAMRSLIWWKF